MHRRHFLHLAALAGAGALLRPRAIPPRALPLRVGLVAADDGASPRTGAFRTGATMGTAEAQRTAAMFGGEVALVHGTTGEALLAAGATALVGGATDDECARLGALAARAGIPFLNVGATADALRDGCLATTFHVAASEAMHRAARAQAGAAADAPVLLWHPTLERFGAAQLNDRARATGHEMTGDAWAAWLAVKLLAEGALRVREETSAALVAWLARPGNRLDGHKGAPLAFEAGSRQLRQPLYVLHEARVREVPARAHHDGDAVPRPACPTESP